MATSPKLTFHEAAVSGINRPEPMRKIDSDIVVPRDQDQRPKVCVAPKLQATLMGMMGHDLRQSCRSSRELTRCFARGSKKCPNGRGLIEENEH